MSANPDVNTRLDRFFFAIRLSEAAVVLAYDEARRVSAACGLRGKFIPADRLHVTLHWLQDHDGIPRELLDRAMVAGAGINMAPFGVLFDRVESLGDLNHGGPLALTGSAGLASLRKLQRALASEMTDAGIGMYVRSGFKPHVTLLYDDKYVAPQTIVPVSWMVDELVLVHSLVGRSRHIVLGRWPLQSRQIGVRDW